MLTMTFCLKTTLVVVIVVFGSASPVSAAEVAPPGQYTKTLGIRMIRIEPGSFMMGQAEGGNWDEQPVHKVTITQPFYISETEITVEQFRRFRSDFAGTEQYSPCAAGLSWYEAKAFCDWLSKKESKSYRLPTEAEWEYACRAGTDTAFWSGDSPPERGTANPWGLKNMHTGVREWCLDWYGKYPSAAVTNPVGPARGFFKIVRGGALDEVKDRSKYARSSSRAGMGLAFGPYSGSPNEFGFHNIGFRVVQAPPPRSKPLAYDPSFVEQGVKQNQQIAIWGPGPDKPYFRKRYMLPTPPENCDRRAIDAAGLHPAFRGHNHSPGFEICPNGDLLLAIHTSYHEYEPEVAVMAARLRCGAQQWDMPDIIFDVPGVGDPAPMLWNDNGTLYFFCGNARLKNAFPFHWTTSTDNGATWSEFKYPNFRNKVGPHTKQPINTALRDKNGMMYVSSDGKGGTSVLWATSDNGKTWYDTIGRSGGRHTTYVMLKDAGILGIGGKNTDIDGFMPQSVSRDGGRTWEVTRTVFPAQGSNQRPSVLRLKSGRLFFAGDFQHIRGHQPEGIAERGSYVALSDDEARTWKLKKLIGTQQHENPKAHNGAHTIGYSVARQAPNGLIHLITTMNRPCLHFAFSEAWILHENSEYDRMSDEQLMASRPTVAGDVREYEERYANGHVRVRYGGCIAEDGRFLLHGAETWYYEDGSRQRQAAYHLGRKVGKETFWARDGSKKWQWQHHENGTSVWTQFWSNGKKKGQSTWRNHKCDGIATCWDQSGKVITKRDFTDGELAD
ncbi:MAG: SUMF1/EgtB/PvdO family nonheme iron enzyme [Planctomycetota bacterium]